MTMGVNAGGVARVKVTIYQEDGETPYSIPDDAEVTLGLFNYITNRMILSPAAVLKTDAGNTWASGIVARTLTGNESGLLDPAVIGAYVTLIVSGSTYIVRVPFVFELIPAPV